MHNLKVLREVPNAMEEIAEVPQAHIQELFRAAPTAVEKIVEGIA